MPKSAGILLYRRRAGRLEVLLAHPGGPFWRNRDDGAWTIPKGLVDANESAEDAARREFREELGVECSGTLVALGSIRQRGGKVVEAFALEGDFSVETLASNTFELEWPPRSGQTATFPEIDRAEWMDLALARVKMLEAQRALLDRLASMLAAS
jgi:predicted NUDIX family NTP pyrophosphohydrolase